MEKQFPQISTALNNDVTGIFQLLCANCNWIKRYENNEVSKKRGKNKKANAA